MRGALPAAKQIPGFSRVCSMDVNENRFNGFRAPAGGKPLKRLAPRLPESPG